MKKVLHIKEELHVYLIVINAWSHSCRTNRNFNFILFYSTLFCSILCHSIFFYSGPFCFVTFYPLPLHSYSSSYFVPISTPIPTSTSSIVLILNHISASTHILFYSIRLHSLLLSLLLFPNLSLFLLFFSTPTSMLILVRVLIPVQFNSIDFYSNQFS